MDVALSAGTSVSDLLSQMKTTALAAADTTLDTASRNALNDQFKSLRDQITKVTSNAVFNGGNMIKAVARATTIKALANAGRHVHDHGCGSGPVPGRHGADERTSARPSPIGTVTTTAATMIGYLNTAIANVSSALSKLGTGSKALASHLTFIQSLQDSINTGIGNLVDADMAQESAQLQALQTKQQLGIQALSIANQSSATLLGLFR